MARRRAGRRMVRRQGRQGLWVRYETFTPSEFVTAPAISEDALIFPELWEREENVLIQPKRGAGGAVLKRAFGSVMWEIREDETVNTVLVPNCEVLIFAAATTEPAATVAGDFAANLESQRVLHYSMHGFDNFANVVTQAGTRYRWSQTIEFDIKVGARLAGQDIVMMTRCSETETVDVDIGVRAQFSAYITTP